MAKKSFTLNPVGIALAVSDIRQANLDIAASTLMKTGDPELAFDKIAQSRAARDPISVTIEQGLAHGIYNALGRMDRGVKIGPLRLKM